MRDVLEPHRIGNLLLLPATYVDSIYLPSEVILVKGNNHGLYFDMMNGLHKKIEHDNALFVNIWRHIKILFTS